MGACRRHRGDKMKYSDAVWYLRVAASQWLREHADDPNAETLRKALEATEEKQWAS
jgi:hypothetical protein